jgi:hypothetical protein
LRARIKFLLWTTFSTGLAAFSLYQLHRASIYGEVYSGPMPLARYVDFASNPFWFVFGVAVYLVGFSLFSIGTYLSIRGEIRSEKIWRRRVSQPPLEKAIRRPTRDDHP